MSAPDFGPLFDAAAEDLGTVGTSRTGSGTEYRRGPRAFAVITGAAAEFRLRADVAEAVSRTPDVTASMRGEGWVRFAPTSDDRSVLDRAEAWFLSAWRTAEG